MAQDIIHEFERAGLGEAPFRLVGVKDTSEGANSDGLVSAGTVGGLECLTTPGGTCAYCGRAIIILCSVKSFDGRRFHVGSDCIKKVGDKGLTSSVKKRVAALRTKKRNAATDRRVAKTKELLLDSRIIKALKSVEHPQPWRADKGETMLDWCSWMLKHSGRSGSIKVCQVVEKASKEIR